VNGAEIRIVSAYAGIWGNTEAANKSGRATGENIAMFIGHKDDIKAVRGLITICWQKLSINHLLKDKPGMFFHRFFGNTAEHFIFLCSQLNFLPLCSASNCRLDRLQVLCAICHQRETISRVSGELGRYNCTLTCGNKTHWIPQEL